MRYPVTIADGKTYERSAIVRWLREHNTSPLTGLPLPNKKYNDNDNIKKEILLFIEQHSVSDLIIEECM